jgi:hypothetical protein
MPLRLWFEIQEVSWPVANSFALSVANVMTYGRPEIRSRTRESADSDASDARSDFERITWILNSPSSCHLS